VLVQHERPLERGGRALERLPEHRDKDPASVEALECVAQALGSGERVVLVATLPQAGRGREVVVGSHRHDDEVRIVVAGVGRDPPRNGVDARHGLLPELDTVLHDIAVVQPDIVGG
jgi:hypothetical protein